MTAARPSAVSRFFSAVDRDAAGDGVGRRPARWAFWVPAAGAVALAVCALHRPTFLAIVREDGPVEWLQFVGFLAAAILLGVATAVLTGRRDIAAALLIGVGALGFLGIAGEEISWGQRIFGLATPEELAEINHQGELNLHNITSFPVQRIGNVLQLILGGGGALLPWLTRVARPPVRHRLLRLLSPSLFLTPAFGMLFAYRAVRFVWDNDSLTTVKFGEWPELTFALGIAAYAFLLLRSLRREEPSPAGLPPSQERSAPADPSPDDEAAEASGTPDQLPAP